MVARSGRQAGVLGSICARLLGLLTQLSIVVDLEDSVHNGIVVEARLIARVVAAGVPGLTDKEAVGRDATDGLQPGMAHGCLHHATENECTGKRVLGDHHGCERGAVDLGLPAGTGWEIVPVSRPSWLRKRWVFLGGWSSSGRQCRNRTDFENKKGKR